MRPRRLADVALPIQYSLVLAEVEASDISVYWPASLSNFQAVKAIPV